MKIYKCKYAPCYNTSDKAGYCSKHIHLEDQFKKQRDRDYDKNRRPIDKRSRDFYGSNSWRVTKENLLFNGNPLCNRCGQLTKKLATQVHHHYPLKSEIGWENRHNPDYLIPLCDRCHDLVERYRTQTKDSTGYPEQYEE